LAQNIRASLRTVSVSTKKGRTYFLSSRHAAKVCPGLSHQTAHSINGALAEIGAIDAVCPGDERKGGKATEFRLPFPQPEGNKT
jgi:hypothetical protein